MMTKVTYTQTITTEVEVEVPDRYFRKSTDFDYDELDSYADLFLITLCISPGLLVDSKLDTELSDNVRELLIDDLYSEDTFRVNYTMERFVVAYKLADAVMERIN